MPKVLPSTKVSLPAPRMDESRAISSAPTSMPLPASNGHMSSEVRADVGKLSPELRAGLLKAADEK